jgi:hypothetical protein
MSIEAMKQALEALEQIDAAMPFPVGRGAITALRAALEQARELEDWGAVAGMMKIEQEKSQEDNEQLIYDAWRDSEAYGIPMTEEGGKLAQNRFRSFRQGWEYHQFYLEHGDVYMKDYLERQDYDE